jgi:hypothetical protein
MIAANKKLIQANLTQGVVGIQSNLISLYSNNLNSVGTQAALIAGFAFAAIASIPADISTSSYAKIVLMYLYFAAFTICFITALFALSQTTIASTYGPRLALMGENATSVKTATDLMKNQQALVYKIGIVSITSLFIGACCLSWSLYPIGCATITTFLYILGYYVIAKEGIRAYQSFLPHSQSNLISTAEYPGSLAGNVCRKYLR